MRLLIKRVLYKLLVASMITVLLSFFSVTSVSHAKLSLEEGEYYYSGVQEAEVTWEDSFLKKLATKFGHVVMQLFGFIFLMLRGVTIGWIEIAEIVLTALLGVELHPVQYLLNSVNNMDAYEQDIVNVEKIIFNRVDVLDINIFKALDDDNNNQQGSAQQQNSNSEPDPNASKNKKETKSEKLLKLIQKATAEWYVILRLIVIAFMLVLLIFIGIKMAISTIASDKAVYKKMIADWVVGMIIIFMIHYIMVFIVNINEKVVDSLSDLSIKRATTKEYQYGEIPSLEVDPNQGQSVAGQSTTNNSTSANAHPDKTPSEIETTLYESARTRAYSLNIVDGFTGMIIYGALVYYAWKFALIYFRRMINIMILTAMAPIVGGTYAFNKTMSGKATIFSNWLKEYVMNVIIQLFHAIVYVTFVSIALDLSLISLVGAAMALIILKFMSTSDKLLRELFNVSGGTGSLFGEMAEHTSFKNIKSEFNGLKNAVIGGTLGKEFIKLNTRVASKPVRKAAEVGFTKYIQHRAKSGKYVQSQIDRKKETRKSWNRFMDQDDVKNKRNELEENEKNLTLEQARAKDRKKNLQEQLASEEEKKQKEIDIKRRKLEVEKKKYKRQFDNEKKSKKVNHALLHNLRNKIKQKEDEILANEEERDKFNDVQKRIMDEIKTEDERIKNLTVQLQQAKGETDEFWNEVQNEFVDFHIDNMDTTEYLKSRIEGLLDPALYLDERTSTITEAEIKSKIKELFGDDYEKFSKIANGENIPSNYSEEARRQAIEDAKEIVEGYEERAKAALTYDKTKETKREGDSNKAFWRKKKSGIGKTFFENAKWDEILGLSSEETKILKTEFKFAKDTVTGVVSGILGTAMIGVNPGASLLLLSKASSSRSQNFARMLQLNNSSINSRYSYKFKGFTPTTQKYITRNFEREIKFAESEITRRNASKHRKFTNAILNGTKTVARPFGIFGSSLVFMGLGIPIGEGISGSIASRSEPAHYRRKVVGVHAFAEEELDRIHQKKRREELKSAHKALMNVRSEQTKDEYKTEFQKYQDSLKKSTEKMSERDLAVDDALAVEDTMMVGDTIVRFNYDTIPQSEFDDSLEYDERLQQVTTLLKNNRAKYIRKILIQLSIAKGVTDINNLFLDEVDRIYIQEEIRNIFEARGAIRKGDIKIKEIVDRKSIEKALNSMKDTQFKARSDRQIATKMVQQACFGYMKKNGFTDKKMLKTEEARKEIEQTVRFGLMTKSSQQSYGVVSQLTGGQQNANSFKMPSIFTNISLLINEVVGKMETTKVASLASSTDPKDKKRATKRREIREENKTKMMLERAVHTGNTDDFYTDNGGAGSGDQDKLQMDESKLRMLLLLTELQSINREAYKVEGKTKQKKEQTLLEMIYQQRGESQYSYETFEDESRYTEDELMPRERELNILLHGKNDVVKIINS